MGENNNQVHQLIAQLLDFLLQLFIVALPARHTYKWSFQLDDLFIIKVNEEKAMLLKKHLIEIALIKRYGVKGWGRTKVRKANEKKLLNS
jgi:hypothetical protein